MLIQADARNIPLADKSIHCCVTSPPYWGLRDYGVEGQLGLEKTPSCGKHSKLQIREDVNVAEAAMALRGILFGVWGRTWEATCEGLVPILLSEEVQARAQAANAGTEPGIVSPPCEGQNGTNKKASSISPYRDDSIARREMRVLRRNRTDFPLSRSHQEGRAEGLPESWRPARSLAASNGGGIAEGQVPNSLLELQLGARHIRLLPAFLIDKSSVPTAFSAWFRDAGCGECYICHMLEVFREIRRVLRDDGTLWLNIGDSYCSTAPGSMGDKLNQRGILAGVSDRRAEGSRKPRAETPNGMKPKDLVGIPWMVAFALRADGWYLRSDIIWSKPNPMPESVTDRPTKAHEYIFLLSKSQRYYYDADAILEPVSLNTHMRLAQDVAAQIGSERANGGAKTNGNMKAVSRRPKAWDVDMGSNRTLVAGHPRKTNKQDAAGNRRYTGFNERWKVKHNDSFDAAVCLPVNERNKRTVWTVNVQGFAEAHFATFPEELIKPCILAGCPQGGIVLDPFMGSGTTALVARNLQCNAVGLELNAAYIEIAKRRLAQEVMEFV